jgi:hypothetical protein
VKLPHGDAAIIPREKITEYLLNPSHPDGWTKAAFFVRFGFRQDDPVVLEQALLHLARTIEMTEVIFKFGRKYVGTGWLRCPDGRQAEVVTVWVLRDNQPPPFFVTAYPA